MTRRVLIVLKSPPQEAGLFEALRIVLSFVGMDLLPHVVFADDAVLAFSPRAVFPHKRVREYLESVVEMTDACIDLESLSDGGLDYDSIRQLWALRGITPEEFGALIIDAETVFAL